MLSTAVVGLYPQVRSLRTILTGLGWLQGSWEALQLVNERKIFSVEPVLESLIQVYPLVVLHLVVVFSLHIDVNL
jgi:hypothetical protein